MTKAGAGTLVLSNANTYTGATTLNAGVVNITNTNTLGTAAAGTTIQRRHLQLQGVSVTGEALTIANAAAVARKRDRHQQLDAAPSSSAATGPSRPTAASNRSPAGVISGAGGLTKTGTGTLVLHQHQHYTGTTTLNAGVVNIANATALGGTAEGTTINAATLQMQGVSVTGEPLTIANTAAVLENVTGTNTWSGTIALSATGTIQTDARCTLTTSAV